MKRIISLLFAVIMLVSALGITGFSVSAFIPENVVVTVDGSESNEIETYIDNTDGTEYGLSENASECTFVYSGTKSVSSWQISGITESSDYEIVVKTEKALILAVNNSASAFTVNAVTADKTVPHSIDIYENDCDTPSSNFSIAYHGTVTGYNIAETYGIDSSVLTTSVLYIIKYTGGDIIDEWTIESLTEDTDYCIVDKNITTLRIFIKTAYTGTVSIDTTVSCRHKWDDGVVITEPTCGKDGKKLYTCSICSNTKTEVIAATGEHSWGEPDIVKAPTCTNEGLYIYTCTVCEKENYRLMPPTGIHAPVTDAAVEPTFNADGKTEGSHCGKCGTIIVKQTVIPKLSGTKITKLSRGKKRFTVKWSKAANTDGYQIQYSLKKNMKSAKTVTVNGNANIKKTIKKLKKSKRYYVRVRAFKTINGVKQYSAWSAKKNIKTK